MLPRNTTFISYARLDGVPFASELSQRLQTELGISVWQDRIRMGPGDFEQQIKQAIDSAEYLVVVITPGALRSQWVEKEWRYARENGVCICPIQPKFPSASMELEVKELRAKWPRWMQQIQTFDFEGYWKRFVAVLQSPCQATRAPFLARSLPANFVGRPSQHLRIINGILDDGHKTPSGKTVVLYGSGGFGKTTLALNVCHDEDVFAVCDGGILWATLGAEPKPISELTTIYAALTGERPQFATLDDAMIAVSQKLEGKRCLMVIDDVWQDDHLAPFLQGGEQSSRLITTRRFDIALDHTVQECQVNVAELTPAEAQEVLTARLLPPPPAPPPTPALLFSFRQLAARFGEWPLLLQLANRTLYGQVARGRSVEDALKSANELYDKMGVVAFDRGNATAREQAVAKTVELSLGQLNERRQLCLELAIFPEDTDIPLEWIGLVWQTDAAMTQLLAERMDDLALIKLDLSPTPGEVMSSGSVRLHDAMRTYFASQLGEAAPLHARLADAWKDPQRIAGEYAHRYVAYHLAETMADPSQVPQRGRQLLNLLTDPRYRQYREEHGDPLALHRYIILALKRATKYVGADSPALVSTLALAQKSYAESKHNPQLFFEAALAGRVREAEQRLDLSEAEPEWKTLARLLIAWIAEPQNPSEATALAQQAAASCDRPELRTALAWVLTAPGEIPGGLPPIFDNTDQSLVSDILQRAGGAETTQGMEPIDSRFLMSGGPTVEPIDYNLGASGLARDASAFIADRDGPVLVAFANHDPQSNTQFLERYIEIHAANRYRYYRNRSLWALLKSVLVFPEASWVRSILQKIMTAALTVTRIDFEEFLPLTVLGLQARFGDQSASDKLELFRQRLIQEAAGLGAGGSTGAPQPGNRPGDSWSHYQRRACTLAEVYALALDRPSDAASLLDLARQLPKGFAGFRAFSALNLADSIDLVLPSNPQRSQRIAAALESAQAASHRIQDYPFCLRATAMVNAIRMRWWEPDLDLEKVVEDFSNHPLAERFCAVHRVLEDFSFRGSDSLFQSLPIPVTVLNAQTLRQIAEAYRRQSEQLVTVNPAFAIDQQLSKNNNDTVNVPEPDFTPILAARLSAAALAAPSLTEERRSALIQRLVPLAITNRTALDTVLARLLLSARKTKFEMPRLLGNLDVPGSSAPASSSEKLIS
jgi:hypothetical protein